LNPRQFFKIRLLASSAPAAHFADHAGPGARVDEFVDAQVRRMKSRVEWMEVTLTTEKYLARWRMAGPKWLRR
jgi:hypothetical protein